MFKGFEEPFEPFPKSLNFPKTLGKQKVFEFTTCSNNLPKFLFDYLDHPLPFLGNREKSTGSQKYNVLMGSGFMILIKMTSKIKYEPKKRGALPCQLKWGWKRNTPPQRTQGPLLCEHIRASRLIAQIQIINILFKYFLIFLYFRYLVILYSKNTTKTRSPSQTHKATNRDLLPIQCAAEKNPQNTCFGGKRVSVSPIAFPQQAFGGLKKLDKAPG